MSCLRFTSFGPQAVTGRVLWNRVCPSFRPSVLVSRCFLGNISLVFSKFWHVARNPYQVVQDRARFSRKNIFCPQNRLKTGFFWIYWKILSTIFTEIVLWWKFILFAVFLHKSHIWQNSGCWDMGKKVLSQSDCRIF